MKNKHGYALLCYYYLLIGYTTNTNPMVSKMTYRFMVKWPLHRQEFLNPNSYTDSADCMYHRKSLLRLSDTENLSFYLSLGSYWHGYFVSIQPANRWEDISESVYLEYAFVEAQNRMFYLARSNDFQFDATELSYENFRIHEKDLFRNRTMTVHCMISVYADVRTWSPSVDYVQLESSVAVQISTIRTDTCRLWETVSRRDDIVEYLHGGKIPSMNVRRAMEIIDAQGRLRKLDINELSTLSIEYLISHLTVKNVVDVLKLSRKYGIEHLREKCLDFLAVSFIIDS